MGDEGTSGRGGGEGRGWGRGRALGGGRGREGAPGACGGREGSDRARSDAGPQGFQGSSAPPRPSAWRAQWGSSGGERPTRGA